MRKKKKFKLITREDINGFLFVLPFLIGFIWLFMKPLITSLYYTFHRVTMSPQGLVLEPLGLENYRYLLMGDATFLKVLIDQCSQMVIKILVIMFVSIFLAILLNGKFSGRLLFRTILFLPVIFSADQVMNIFTSLGGQSDMTQEANSFMMMTGEATGFVSEIINSFGFLTPIISEFTGYAGKLFNLLWSSGIQIILFIIGLQAIPGYLYEVADIEGATKWETFWKITFPLLTPSMLLCLIYTIIDYFNAKTNPVVKLINDNILNRLDYACTQSWVYAIFIFAFVLVIYKIISTKTIYLD